MRPATPEELTHWDELVVKNPDGGNVLQSKAFGEFKAKHGWESRYFLFENIAFMALVKQIPVFGEMWYVPKGPGIQDGAQLARFIETVRGGLTSRIESEVKPPQVFMVKIDPEIIKDAGVAKKLEQAGLVKTRDIQYNASTVVVDLAPSEEDILASLKQKTRYNIRLAAKKGVTVEAVPTNGQSIDQMYALMQSTQERAGFYLRDKQYFQDFWQLHSEQGTGQMFFAYYSPSFSTDAEQADRGSNSQKKKLLAGAFVTYLGGAGLYKDGGSVREHSDVQPMYALQWEIMRWLKSRGVTEYDLHGVPPADQIDNPNHPLAGLARFKTGFSPEVVEFIGTYDIVVHRASYAVWRACGERLTMAYLSRVKKQLFY